MAQSLKTRGSLAVPTEKYSAADARQALWPLGQTLSAGNLAPNSRRGNSSTTVFRQAIGRKIPAGSVGDHQTSRSESIGFCFRSSQFRHPWDPRSWPSALGFVPSMTTCDSRRIQLQDQGTILTNGRFAQEAAVHVVGRLPVSKA